MKTLKEITKELKEKGYQPLPEGSVTGDEFEEWLRKDKNEYLGIYENPYIEVLYIKVYC